VEAAEGGRAENLEEGVVPVCNVVMVIQPGPTGVWAAERDGGGGGEDGGEEDWEAEAEAEGGGGGGGGGSGAERQCSF